MVSLGVSSILALGSAATMVQLAGTEQEGKAQKNLTALSLETFAAIAINSRPCSASLAANMGFPNGFDTSKIQQPLVDDGLPVSVVLSPGGPSLPGGRILVESPNKFDIGGTAVILDRVRLINGQRISVGSGTDCSGAAVNDAEVWQATLMISGKTTGMFSRPLYPTNAGKFKFVVANGAVTQVDGGVSLNANAANCQDLNRIYDPVTGSCRDGVVNPAGANLDLCPPFYEGLNIEDPPGSGNRVLKCQPLLDPAGTQCPFGSRRLTNSSLECLESDDITGPIPEKRKRPTVGTNTVVPGASVDCKIPASIIWSITTNYGNIMTSTCNATGGQSVQAGSNFGISDGVTSGPDVSTGKIQLKCASGGGLSSDGFACVRNGDIDITCTATGQPSGGTCSSMTNPPDVDTGSKPGITIIPMPPDADPSCLNTYSAYNVCKNLEGFSFLSDSFGNCTLPTPIPGNCGTAVTPAPTAIPSIPPPAPTGGVYSDLPDKKTYTASASCYCQQGQPNIADGEYCGWCLEENYGYGIYSTVYEVNQCQNGQLVYIPNAQGVVPLSQINCTGVKFKAAPATGGKYGEL